MIGFSEILPSMRAVGSPQRLAVQACADSWNEMAKRMTDSWIAKSTILKATRGQYTRIEQAGSAETFPRSKRLSLSSVTAWPAD